MNSRFFICVLFLLVWISLRAQVIHLEGRWRFSKGEHPHFTESIILPGSMLTNGKGDDVTIQTHWTGGLYDSSYYFNPFMKPYRQPGKIKLPFFLTPDKYYVGSAWYEKSFRISEKWKGRKVIFEMERPHIESRLYVNGKYVGRDSSLSVPHRFDITPYVVAGKENTIRVKVYNGIENVCVGQDSHSVTDQTQGNWNGIIGRIRVIGRPRNYIENVQIYPNIASHKIKVELKMVGVNDKCNLHFLLNGRTFRFLNKQCDANGRTSVEIPMGKDVKLWDEFSPNLYQLISILGTDTVRTSFGMREIEIRGKQFYVNGRKAWMRGTVESCCFPMTGYPPTDEASWTRIFRICKEYGLNMMRFHSYCPPEAAFSAADKMGFYLQPEGPSWPNHGVLLGNGMPIDNYLMSETQRMVEEYGNHPSFCMLVAGNEPAGNWVSWGERFVDTWKRSGDNRRVYSTASVGGGWAWVTNNEFHVKGGARGLNWVNAHPQSVDNFNEQIQKGVIKGKNPITFEVNVPFMTHELGQWCAFPDLKEISQYTGVYKAGNFEIFRDLLAANGMASQPEKFLYASGKLQTLAYKYDIERNLRTKDFAGFQLLSLNDYSGQGTALVGVLNVFWNSKGYCSPEEWKQFCSPIVPLAKFPQFVYRNDEWLDIEVEMYNAFKEPLMDAESVYSIEDGQNVYWSGLLSEKDIEIGKNIPLGNIHVSLRKINTPKKLTLRVQTKCKNTVGQRIENRWDFWVYPLSEKLPSVKDIYVTDTLDHNALEILKTGGKVLIEAAGKVRLGMDVKQQYLPVFWNTSWFKMRPPHTTGALIEKEHPLFREFPTDNWANLNWWELLNKAQVMNLKEFPQDYQPPIQPIDTWHVSRKLGMLVEAKVLNGKLIMTTMDISSHLDKRLVARQMKKAILAYMNSNDFHPEINIPVQTIQHLFTQEARAIDMFTNEKPDDLVPQ